ncbi:ABC transporter permease [Sporosarcina sp. ACRSM]|uniref:ABC transporter permease n=1 Tax=Sporosarcina sp. ACRSM TaxID=2918216 RepID=UPI001EF645B4|nr:ABC transporter permease [Sporosarcina sp. ACRSM]MCG7337506.1 ABC transporter permease [Sporosarcina sp. ACRSM]
MNNLRDIWGNRFVHYITELQKYMKYVFTGHLAIVLVFTIGAGGYAYSEWLKEVPTDFSAALLTALIIAAALAISPPATLLKPADTVYFLPLEHRLDHYLGRALSWTTFSQLPLPLLLYIVALPLLSATETGSKLLYIWLAIFIVVLKWLFVETEYAVRQATGGAGVWRDRILRFLLAACIILAWLSPYPYLTVVFFIIAGFYSVYWRKKKSEKPFPYDHFIALEQNRMMRFYRFANYFTDVPHLKGSISRRGWLGSLFGTAKFGKTVPQDYLIRRTFLRTDDNFWLWVRLTALSILGAIFIPFPIVVIIFAGALAFATSVQLIYALRASDEFRMDMLFPERMETRPGAIRKNVRTVQWIQAILVFISALFLYGISSTPLLLAGVILLISEVTIRFTDARNKEH